MKQKSRFAFFLCAALIVTTVLQSNGQVVINEFLADNSKTLADADGEYSDWIELYNAGSQPVPLAGWFLTDAQNNLAKWALPATNLAASSFLVVFASGKDRAVSGAELHANFKLDASGGYLALVKGDGAAIQSEFTYPRQLPDISYGPYDGTNNFFTTCTPGAANVAGYLGQVSSLKFSQKHGFYSSPFNLEITTETATASIHYTTNGTAPSAARGTLYTGPIPINGTTVIRAIGYQTGYLTSRVDTVTYIFTADVIRQATNGVAPSGWPASWGANRVDYGMDPDVVNSQTYKDTIQDDLKTIPSYSIAIELDSLFNASKGIYANASQQGVAWERPCSLELIYPDGREGFQINSGLRIRGGYSRGSDNPKHAFRVFFRSTYGDGKLHYPMFASQDGTESFSGFDLRTFQNYSWSYGGDSRGVFIRDQFSRDTQIDMGQPAERGDYYHLYVDGQYWGLYNSDERPEADYAASYFGGDSANYDVIKVEAGPYTIKATDGNINAWNRLYNQAKAGLTTDATYEKAQGNNPDGTRNPDYEVLLDVDNLIDYMLVILYGGNLDAPISNFLGNTSPNNWYGIRDRTGAHGFRFFCHDSEHTLLDVNENRLGPYTAGNTSALYSSPQWLFQKCWGNAEFKIRLADHAQRHFFNGGTLTPAAAKARFLKRKNEIDRAVVGESARWGDAQTSTPLTRFNWVAAVNNIVDNYFPYRTAIVLNQLVAKGLFPKVGAPVFSQFGGAFNRGDTLTLTATNGVIYYTLDGSDPRLRGGAISAGALAYGGPLTLTESVQVKARALSDTTWSALAEAPFTLIQTYTNLVVSELMYHPQGESGVDADSFEFIELKNLNAETLDLSGVYFTNGIHFVFPSGTQLGAYQFTVLVSDPVHFASRYPGVAIGGTYTGNLSNSGETLALVHAIGTPLFSMTYGDQSPWPQAADGQGFSLVPVNPAANANPNDAANWRASSRVGGSPGAEDPVADIAPVVINEILTHEDAASLDSIELYNPGATAANLGGWYLSNDRSEPKKYRIPAGTTLAPGAYLVFTEAQLGADPVNGFHLAAEGGEVYVFSADAAGNLTGFSDGFSFAGAERGVTFGRYTNSVGEIQFPAQLTATLGGANSGPRVGPVVLDEIYYHPVTGAAEFIELRNLTDAAVPLYDPAQPANPWQLSGVSFAFPAGSTIAAQGYAVLVGGSPEAFRAQYGVPASVPIFGPYAGALQDGGETLRLQKPGDPKTNGAGVVIVPAITVDEVKYSSQSPWPIAAAGLGSSLMRAAANAYGNDPASWKASFGDPSPGLANDGNRRPTVNAGADQTAQTTRLPLVAQLNGAAADDGLPNPPQTLSVTWSQIDGPGQVVFANPNQLNTTASLPGLGSYTLRLTADDGAMQASDDVICTVSTPPAAQTCVATGSVWKYYDLGADLGTAWRALAFNDSGWASGKAQLGYGDGDEATIVAYGPDATAKYVTTYFRRAFTVADAKSITALTVKLLRDDGAIVYLNGVEVFRSNMPESDIAYNTYASEVASDNDETVNFFTHDVDPALLQTGTNVLAVEVHQANAGSSDLSFDLELDAQAYPQNQAPTCDAGVDLTTTLAAGAALRGAFTDDGLPNPPGIVSLAWSQLDGPGTATFTASNQLATLAAFSQTGIYTLRLTVSDSVYSTVDDVRVTVAETGPARPQIISAALVGGDPARLRVQFQAESGQAYTAQYRDSLASGDWQTLREFAPQAVSGTVEFEDDAVNRARFYRVLAH
jgi:hypothetical protein